MFKRECYNNSPSYGLLIRLLLSLKLVPRYSIKPTFLSDKLHYAAY